MIHLTARTLPWKLSLLESRPAGWLWTKLRRGFPHALAACLMPRHLHLVVAADDPEKARERLRRTLAWHARRFGPDGVFRVWEPVPAPSVIDGPKKLARQVRYVVLNPCRANQVDDPLRWLWSTHRDLAGAVADPWVEPRRLAAALRERARGFAGRHHAYVSSDPSVSPLGSPPPEPSPPAEESGQPFEDVVAAAVMAHRARPEELRRRSPVRRTFVHLAERQGWDLAPVARRCSLTTEAVRLELARAAPVEALSAAALCLGDERLLRPPTVAGGGQRR